MSGERILFIDRDGTIIEEPHDQQVDSLQKLRLLPGGVCPQRNRACTKGDP